MKKIKICFIGTGWMGSAQLKQLSKMKDSVEISVVVNNDIEQAREVLQEIDLKSTPVTDSLEIAIKDHPVDIVWIVSPNSFHGAQSIYAMKHNKHVFCEKPASTTFKEFEEQILLDYSNPDIQTLVDYILYFNPMERELIKMVKNDAFGTIHQIQVNYRHPVNISEGKEWKLKKEFIGDALGMGINHAISVILFIMGIQTDPVSVYASSSNNNMRGFETDPVWNIMIRFKNGAVGTCLGNIDIEKGYDLYHNIAGTNGGFIFDSRLQFENKIRLWSDSLGIEDWVYPLKNNKHSNSELLGSLNHELLLPDSGNVLDHQIFAALNHFIDSVRTGTNSPLSFVNSSIIGEIGWAAQLSALTHKEIQLPLSEENKVLLRKL